MCVLFISPTRRVPGALCVVRRWLGVGHVPRGRDAPDGRQGQRCRPAGGPQGAPAHRHRAPGTHTADRLSQPRHAPRQLHAKRGPGRHLVLWRGKCHRCVYGRGRLEHEKKKKGRRKKWSWKWRWKGLGLRSAFVSQCVKYTCVYMYVCIHARLQSSPVSVRLIHVCVYMCLHGCTCVCVHVIGELFQQ